MLWITNHPKPLKGMWPRRVGCTYIEGDPQGTDALTVEQLKAQGTDALTVEQLKAQGLIGVYVDMPAVQYRSLPVAKNPKEFA